MTVDIFSMSLTEKTKLKGLLEIVSTAAEFEVIPIRHHEDVFLRKLYDRVPVKLVKADYNSPYFKTNILLQAHFSRFVLPADLAADQAVILSKVLKCVVSSPSLLCSVLIQALRSLLSACVDVMSSNAFLNALGAMELSQMCVQAMWDSDSPLKQIPGFTSEVISRCVDADVKSVYDIMELEDDQRNSLLQMDTRQMRDVAKFCNAYPSIELAHEVVDADELTAGAPITINISLEREVDEDDKSDQVVPAPFFPVKKTESMWVVVGEPSTKQCVCSFLSSRACAHAFSLQTAVDQEDNRLGSPGHEARLCAPQRNASAQAVPHQRFLHVRLRLGRARPLADFGVSRGADQEHDFELKVAEAADSDEESDDAMDED